MRQHLLIMCVIAVLLGGLPGVSGAANGDDQANKEKQSVYFSAEELQELEILANKGDGDAARKLSLYYDYVAVDPQKGFYWEEKAAENSNADAQYDMGIRYIYDPELRDKEKAQLWFKKAAEQGKKDAEKRYLRHFLSDSEVGKLRLLAKSGDADAAEQLSYFYDSIENDYSEAHYWRNLAAKNKYHRDINVIGGNQSLELSVEQIRVFSIEAEKGDGTAAQNLHFYYDAVALFPSKGFYWLKKAAENGRVAEQYNLGLEYLDKPIIRNTEKALFWFSKSAEKGFAPAKEKVEKFLTADDVEKLSLLANAGDVDAAFKLYQYYYWIEDNKRQAKFWLDIAATNGHPKAQEDRASGFLRRYETK